MYLKIALKFLLFSVATVFVLAAFYLLISFILSKIQVSGELTTKKEVEIYIQSNGVHTDIVMPVKSSQIDWSKEIKYSHTKSADSSAQYVGMGWGDKGFYLDTPNWSDLKASVAFNAAFGLSTTAIHATFYNKVIENDLCVRIVISQDQYAKLIAYITKSFKKTNDGHFIVVETDANYGNTDAFYEAIGSYSLFYTCNTWTNEGLKVAGQKACLWTPFDSSILALYQ
ncbi:TIGR02117 family protein [Flavobacterium algicola]|uniref:TIGR02117 family protein n=1 Tax=Flavobacterium algicola TaxID=556529 RepID=UPI001EFCB5DE|nr:TIGR02117 family protein [Flavobacterium algicola]MCG9792588.1 TIGR02117 family protein [Flavobacterium algicola]